MGKTIDNDNGNGKPKHPGGRPVEWTEERALALVEDMEKWFNEHEDAIAIKEYTSTHGINPQKTSELKYPEFQERFKLLNDLLECRINKLGMVARNPAYPIFLQKNHHGYTDRQDIHSTGNITVNHQAGINAAWLEYTKQQAKLASDDPNKVLPDRVEEDNTSE
jgi:hypothetical protein